MYCIGIDPGKDTGVAIWDTEKKNFYLIKTMQIHEALLNVWVFRGRGAEVYFEDARQRKWFNTHSEEEDRARLQGTGSVKRDSTIWEDALNDWGIPFHAVAPKHNTTKMTAEFFRALTGWKGRTSEHSRDAAMLVFGR